MVDALTRVYMRKANLKVDDEFHKEISLADINILRWASAYIIITPVFGVIFVKLLNKIREDGGLSKVFRSVMYRAR
jgi:hypothetical protein